MRGRNMWTLFQSCNYSVRYDPNSKFYWSRMIIVEVRYNQS